VALPRGCALAAGEEGTCDGELAIVWVTALLTALAYRAWPFARSLLPVVSTLAWCRPTPTRPAEPALESSSTVSACQELLTDEN